MILTSNFDIFMKVAFYLVSSRPMFSLRILRASTVGTKPLRRMPVAGIFVVMVGLRPGLGRTVT